MTLCPEAEFRDSLTDGEFWDYVLLGIRPDDPHPEPEYDPEDFEVHGIIPTPCPECGVVGPCGYDPDGRPYIHVSEDDE